MGLFSKKIYVCSRCGKEYEARIDVNGGVCDECYDIQRKEEKAEKKAIKELEVLLPGYINYGKNYLNKMYSSTELNEIIAQRNAIIERRKFTSEDVKVNSLPYTEVMSFIQKSWPILNENREKGHPIVGHTLGAYYYPGFFMPECFDGTIVDTDEVFAVFLTKLNKISDGKNDGILCILLTSNQYIPVFGMAFVGKISFFSLNKFRSKGGREEVIELMTSLCPKLAYPVCEAKELKKIIKSEEVMRGKMGKDFTLRQIRDAEMNLGIFASSVFAKGTAIISPAIIAYMGYALDKPNT